jgi:type VI protein secretion system component VasF
MSSDAKLPDEANLKQRLKQEHPETRQNFRDGLQDSGHVLRKQPYSRRHHAPTALVVRLFCLALMVILAFVYLWKSSLLKSVH